MTDEGQENGIVFTDEQQRFFDKRIGQARIKAREKTQADAERDRLATENEWKKLAEMHEGRVQELEPYEIEAKAYRVMITNMLKDRVKELGDAAKVAVKALPDSLTDLEKLNWLNKSQALFEAEGISRVGTPAKRKKLQQAKDQGREQHRRLRM